MKIQSLQNRHISELFSLQGRVALITGAAGHLGSAMTEGLCEAGARVLINGRDGKTLQALNDQLSGRGYDIHSIRADITTVAGRKIIVNAVKQIGKLHILVNNAYNPSTGTMETSLEKDFTHAYDIAVVAAFSLMKGLKKYLCLGTQGSKSFSSVINICSMYGTVSPDLGIYAGKGHENPPYYGAAKAALLQLTRYVACEWGSQGIRVNAISPGPFPKAQIKVSFPELLKNFKKKNPLGRIGDPVELKGALVFLASEASSYVTGANIPVDGGWTAW